MKHLPTDEELRGLLTFLEGLTQFNYHSEREAIERVIARLLGPIPSPADSWFRAPSGSR